MEGKVFSYIHHNGQVGSLVKVSTITDFAALTDEFKRFGNSIAMFIAAYQPKNIEELLETKVVENFDMPSEKEITIKEKLNSLMEVLGEEVVIEDFIVYSIK